VTATLPTPPPNDPLPVAMRWLAEATARERRNPNAMALATVDVEGRPSARMVLLKELAAPGYGVFYTNYGSRKARELDAVRRAAAVLHWDDLGRLLHAPSPIHFLTWIRQEFGAEPEVCALM